MLAQEFCRLNIESSFWNYIDKLQPPKKYEKEQQINALTTKDVIEESNIACCMISQAIEDFAISDKSNEDRISALNWLFNDNDESLLTFKYCCKAISDRLAILGFDQEITPSNIRQLLKNATIAKKLYLARKFSGLLNANIESEDDFEYSIMSDENYAFS